jgi:hypothetical protein
MFLKRAFAVAAIAALASVTASSAFASTSTPPQGSLSFGSTGQAPALMTTGTSGGYLTTVQLFKNPGTRTQMGGVDVRFEKWRTSDHTLMSYYDFFFTTKGRLAAGMTGTKFSLSGSAVSCASYVGNYTITKAANSGSTITALSISFSEHCAATPAAVISGTLSFHVK